MKILMILLAVLLTACPTAEILDDPPGTPPAVDDDDDDSGEQTPPGPVDAVPGSCEPNPCTEPGRTTCRVADEQLTCLCDDGYLLTAGGECAPDVCHPNPCSQVGRTQCSAIGQEFDCSCEDGLAADTYGRCVETPAVCATGAWPTWEYPLSDGGELVVGVDGSIYVVDGGDLVSIDASGAFRWSYPLGTTGGIPAEAPDGTVVVGGVDGTTTALDPDTGGVLWTYDAGYGTCRAAFASDGTAYICGGADDATIVAMSTAGVPLWTFPVAESVGSPAVGADGTVYVGGDSVLSALDANGVEQWSTTPPGEPRSIEVRPDGTLVVANYNGISVHSSAGDLLWQHSAPASSQWATVGPGGEVYVASETLFARDPGGAALWAGQISGDRLTGSVLMPDDRVLVGEQEGALVAAFDSDGTRRWTYADGGHLLDVRPGVLPDGSAVIAGSGGVMNFGVCPACSGPHCDGDALWGCDAQGDGFVLLEDCAASGATCSDGGCRLPAEQVDESWLGCWDDNPWWFDSNDELASNAGLCLEGELCLRGECVSCWEDQSTICMGDNAYWQDECGNVSDLAESCDSDTQLCMNGGCVDCAPTAYTACVGGHPFWFDSCGRQGDQADTCTGQEVCQGGACVDGLIVPQDGAWNSTFFDFNVSGGGTTITIDQILYSCGGCSATTNCNSGCSTAIQLGVGSSTFSHGGLGCSGSFTSPTSASGSCTTTLSGCGCTTTRNWTVTR